MDEYDLPNDPFAGKRTDPRYLKYVRRYGEVFVELDALHPRQLQTMLREAIEAELDMEVFTEQKEIEEDDNDQIEEIRIDIINLVEQRLGITINDV